MQKVVLITGVSSGFGRAIAEELLNRGHIVYGTIRKNIPSPIDGLIVKQLDVTDKGRVESVVSEIVSEQGCIDVLINNAGAGIAGAVELASDEEIALQMGANFYGVVNMCRAVLPYFRKQKSGTIINMSSIGGIFSVPYQGFYSVSKSAVEAYSEALSLELHNFGVKVVVLEPGDFNTGFTKNRRVSKLTLESDDYSSSFKRVLANIEKDEQNGGIPKYLAKKVGKIINKKNPKFRYVITPYFAQKLSIFAHKILPNNLFHSILRRFYKV